MTLFPRGARRLGAVVAAVVMAAGALSACGAASSGGSSRANDDLIIGRAMDIQTLDIDRSFCDTCQIYNSAVYDTLVKFNAKTLGYDPMLADSWEISPDFTKYTFHLHAGATFADGSPVTSADVKFSFLRLENLKGSGSFMVSSIKSIDTPDDETVVINLSYPNSAFLSTTSASYLGIVNSKLAIANGATDDANADKTDKAEQWFMSNSAGSGPYVLTSYTEGDSVVLTRNDNYWGTKGNFTKVTIKEVSDSSSQLQQLQQGDIDVAMQLSFDALDQAQSDSNLSVSTVPSYNFVYLVLSPGVKGGEALKNPKVRQAFREGIDYSDVINAVVAGHGKPLSAAIPLGFEGTAENDTPTYNPDDAKALLAAAGYGSGLTIEATYPKFVTYGVDFDTMFQAIQQSLTKVGINLKLTPVDYNTFIQTVNSTGYPLSAIYFAPDYPDSSEYAGFFGQVDGGAFVAASGLPVDPTQNKLLGQALSESGDARKASYTQLAQAMAADNIILPIVEPDMILASSSDLTGVNYDATRNLDLSQMKFN